MMPTHPAPDPSHEPWLKQFRGDNSAWVLEIGDLSSFHSNVVLMKQRPWLLFNWLECSIILVHFTRNLKFYGNFDTIGQCTVPQLLNALYYKGMGIWGEKHSVAPFSFTIKKRFSTWKKEFPAVPFLLEILWGSQVFVVVTLLVEQPLWKEQKPYRIIIISNWQKLALQLKK